MKDKLEDLKLRLRTDRRIWAVAGFIGLVLMFGMFSGKERKPRSNIDMSGSSTQSPGTGTLEAYRDLTVAFKSDIQNLTQASKEQSAVLRRVAGDLKEHKQRTAGIFESVVDKIEQLGKEVDRLANSRTAPSARRQSKPPPAGSGRARSDRVR